MQLQYNGDNFLDGIANFFGVGKKARQKRYFNETSSYELNKGKVYINTQVPNELINSIPQLSVPVSRLAAMFSNGEFKIENKDGEIEDLSPELKTLLDKPNVMQSQNEWLKQYLKQLIMYGNQYIYPNKPSSLSAVPKTLVNISPRNLTPVLTGKFLEQFDILGIVERFEYVESGKTFNYKANEILWSKIEDLDNPLVGKSVIQSLQFPLSNTELAYKYLNVISGERGNIGMISRSPSKDGMGILPTTTEEKEELEREFRQRNGIEDHQKKIMITTQPVSWTPMTYPTGQLLLLEQIDANFLTILNALGININVFVNSTYDNLLHGLKSTHNDTIVPYADGLCQKLTPVLGIKDGKKLVLDYSHLPYLQKDNKAEAETLNVLSNSLNTLVTGGIIDSGRAVSILSNITGVI